MPRAGTPDAPANSMTTTEQPDPFGTSMRAFRVPSGPRAGFWIRFFAMTLDGLVLLVPFMVTAVATGVSTGRTVFWLLFMAYFTLLEGGPSGQSLGKRACGIRVVDLLTGEPIGRGRALIRALGRLVSFVAFLLGYLWMVVDREKQTWHDKMARSVVVPVRG